MCLGSTIRALLATVILVVTFGVPFVAAAHSGHAHGASSERVIAAVVHVSTIAADGDRDGDHGTPACPGECPCLACHLAALPASEAAGVVGPSTGIAVLIPPPGLRPDVVPEVLPKPPRQPA